MSNITALLVVGLITVGILSGILRVEFHPENFATLTTWASDQIGNQEKIDPYRQKAVEAKRNIELKIFSDKDKQMDLSLAYVKADADRLKRLIEKDAAPNTIIEQASMVLKSLHRVERFAQDVRIQRLAEIKPKIQETFISTQQSLMAMKGKGIEIEYINTDFTMVAQAFEKYIGQVLSPEAGSVAGTADKKE